jgi:hypothetical protein
MDGRTQNYLITYKFIHINNMARTKITMAKKHTSVPTSAGKAAQPIKQEVRASV